jgi:hypothetical protein
LRASITGSQVSGSLCRARADALDERRSGAVPSQLVRFTDDRERRMSSASSPICTHSPRFDSVFSRPEARPTHGARAPVVGGVEPQSDLLSYPWPRQSRPACTMTTNEGNESSRSPAYPPSADRFNER